MYTTPATILAACFVLGTASALHAQDPAKLPAVVVKATVEKPGARAIAGVVRDTFTLGIDSVEISIPSIQRRVFSDADGRFRLTDVRGGKYAIRARKIRYAPQVREVVDVKPGQHAVMISHTGYADKLVSVTVPEDSGRHVSVFMPPRDHARSVREAGNIMDLNGRLAWRSPNHSTFYTHQDLARFGWEWMGDAVRHGAILAGHTGAIGNGCYGILNGGPGSVLVAELTADEVESLEIYPASTMALNLLPNRPSGGTTGAGKAGVAQSKIGAPISNTDEAAFLNLGVHPPCPTVYVWTR